MQGKILETDVDRLVEFVKNRQNVSVSTICQHFKLPVEIVERWLVVLEEFGVLQVNYSGFEGYVKISQKEINREKDEAGVIDVDSLKDLFIEKSKAKNFTYDKMREVWPIFISEYEKDIKALFEDKAKASGFEMDKVDKAWDKYKKELLVL